jgi:hypothetical protein
MSRERGGERREPETPLLRRGRCKRHVWFLNANRPASIATPAGAARLSMGVLPFANLSGDPAPDRPVRPQAFEQYLAERGARRGFC